jgi:hypothetical protein
MFAGHRRRGRVASDVVFTLRDRAPTPRRRRAPPCRRGVSRARDRSSERAGTASRDRDGAHRRQLGQRPGHLVACARSDARTGAARSAPTDARRDHPPLRDLVHVRRRDRRVVSLADAAGYRANRHASVHRHRRHASHHACPCRWECAPSSWHAPRDLRGHVRGSGRILPDRELPACSRPPHRWDSLEARGRFDRPLGRSDTRRSRQRRSGCRCPDDARPCVVHRLGGALGGAYSLASPPLRSSPRACTAPSIRSSARASAPTSAS